MDKKYGALSSSEDPQKLADTVKGAILGGGVLIIFGLKYFGIEVGSEDISEFAIQAGSAISAVWIAYGAVKKVILFVHSKF